MSGIEVGLQKLKPYKINAWYAKHRKTDISYGQRNLLYTNILNIL